MSYKEQCGECAEEIQNGEPYYAVAFSREVMVGGSVTVENSTLVQAYHKKCLPKVLDVEILEPLHLLCDEPRG